MEYFKLFIDCPECEKEGLRLVVEDDAIQARLICHLCKKVDQEVDLKDLCSIVAGITERVSEDTDDKHADEDPIDGDWLVEFIAEKLVG